MENLSPEIIEFLNKTRLAGYDVTSLAGDASDRKYYRLKQGKHSLILMDSSKIIEIMKSFLSARKYLSDNKLSVPQVFQVDLNKGYMILEDFGDNTLGEYLIENPKDLKSIYNLAVDLLAFLVTLEDSLFPEFNKQFFLDELSIFTTWYTPFIDKPLEDEELVKFKICWSEPLAYLSINDKKKVFVHKDLHCGNLFWLSGRSGVKKLGIIDFQSAKMGSGVYDIISFLYDCRISLPADFRKNLLKRYLSSKGWDFRVSKNLCDIYIAQRNIKILGNFAYIYQQKDNGTYLKFLTNAWEFINESLKNPILKDVKNWLVRNEIQAIERFL